MHTYIHTLRTYITYITYITVLKSIARAAAAREQVQPSALYAELLQEASVLVRGHRGRAALHRRAAISVVASAPAGVATAAAAALLAP